MVLIDEAMVPSHVERVQPAAPLYYIIPRHDKRPGKEPAMNMKLPFPIRESLRNTRSPSIFFLLIIPQFVLCLAVYLMGSPQCGSRAAKPWKYQRVIAGFTLFSGPM